MADLTPCSECGTPFVRALSVHSDVPTEGYKCPLCRLCSVPANAEYEKQWEAAGGKVLKRYDFPDFVVQAIQETARQQLAKEFPVEDLKMRVADLETDQRRTRWLCGLFFSSLTVAVVLLATTISRLLNPPTP